MTDIQTTYLGSREVAKILRRKLRESFPGIKFSVRCGTGTAYSWLAVSWIDGPTDEAVRAITDRWHGERFNGMTDGYDRCEPLLVAINSGELPVSVRPSVSGINHTREFSLARLQAAQEIVRGSIPDFDAVTPDENSYRWLSGPTAGTWYEPTADLWRRGVHRDTYGAELVYRVAATL